MILRILFNSWGEKRRFLLNPNAHQACRKACRISETDGRLPYMKNPMQVMRGLGRPGREVLPGEFYDPLWVTTNIVVGVKASHPPL
jgi:hypothetical protein